MTIAPTKINTPTSTPTTMPQGSDLNVSITGSIKKDYNLGAYDTLSLRYSGFQNGPVKVISPRGFNIFASQRVYYGDSFNEVLGYPASQFTTEYWFPWYDGSTMTTWILVGNPSSDQTANVDIYVGSLRNSYTIPPGGRITPKFPGIVDGPVGWSRPTDRASLPASAYSITIPSMK